MNKQCSINGCKCDCCNDPVVSKDVCRYINLIAISEVIGNETTVTVDTNLDCEITIEEINDTRDKEI